jgi:hypothetical protein
MYAQQIRTITLFFHSCIGLLSFLLPCCFPTKILNTYVSCAMYVTKNTMLRLLSRCEKLALFLKTVLT